MCEKIFISFFVLFLFGCTPSAQKADIKEKALPREKTTEAKPGEIVQFTTMKAFHIKCFSCHSDPDKGQLYPFIKTKSNRVTPHTRKPFSRIEAICTSCHDFFHYIHPEGVGFNSEHLSVPAKIELDNGKINCLSCHSLHQKEPSYKNLIPPIKGKDKLKEFCLNCHREIKQVQDDVYYTLTELRTLTMKELNIFLENSENNWLFQGPIFVKRFYENMKGEKISDQIQVEESFKIRKYSSLALNAITDGNLNEAIHLLWTIFRRKSDFAQSYSRLADGIASIGRTDEAKEIYLHSLEIDNTYAPAYFGLGKIMTHQEEYWEAIDYYRKAVRYDPQMRKAYFEMGKCYILVKNYSEGIRAYREVINLDPKNLEGYLKLAQLYLSTNNYNNAIRSLTDALFFYPEHFEIHYELGNAYYAKYNFNQALTSYKKALEIKPNDVKTSTQLGRTYEMLEEPAKAIRNYENAITSDRYSLEGYLHLAHLYRKLKNFSKVKEASRAALRIRPDSIEIRLTLGDAYFQTKDYSQAEQEYKEILSLNPDHKEANFRLGILYHQDGQDEMAVNTLQKLVEAQSNRVEVYLLLGECLKNDPDEAIRIYQQGIENCAEKTVLYFNLAYYYWKELESPDQAQELFEKAINSNPKYAKAYFYLGRLMKEENNIPQAIFFLEKAIGIDPTRIDVYLLLVELNKEKYYQLAQEKILKMNLVDFKDISAVPNAQYELVDTKEREELYYKLGMIYLTNSRWNNAVEAFSRVLKWNPAHSRALSNLIIAYKAQKKLDQALEKLTRLSKLYPEISEIYIEIGNIHKQMGQEKLAFQNYLEAKDFVPDGDSKDKDTGILQKLNGNKEELLAQGDRHYQDQEYFQAEREYKAILSIDPHNPEASLRLWRLYSNSNRKDMATAILREMVEEKSSRAEFYLLLGEQSDPEEAIEIYRQGVKYSINKAVLYFNIGYLYWKILDEIDFAKEAFEKAIAEHPAYAKAYLYLGHIFKDSDDMPQAVKLLEKAIELDPDRIDAYLLLAELGKGEYYQKLFYDVVLDDFNEISEVPYAQYELNLQDSRQKKEFYYKLGTIYMANGKWENAAVVFNRILKWNPDNTEVMDKLGIAYKAQGQFQNALKTLFQLLIRRPEDPEVFFEIGNIYKEMGRNEPALENYLKAQAVLSANSTMDGKLDLALAEITYNLWDEKKKGVLLVKAKNYHQKALATYPERQDLRRRQEKIEKLLNGYIQIFMVETKSKQKYWEITRRIGRKYSIEELQSIVREHPRQTQIIFVHPQDLDESLRKVLNALKDGELSPVIQKKRKYIRIYRIASIEGGKTDDKNIKSK